MWQRMDKIFQSARCMVTFLSNSQLQVHKSLHFLSVLVFEIIGSVFHFLLLAVESAIYSFTPLSVCTEPKNPNGLPSLLHGCLQSYFCPCHSWKNWLNICELLVINKTDMFIDDDSFVLFLIKSGRKKYKVIFLQVPERIQAI